MPFSRLPRRRGYCVSTFVGVRADRDCSGHCTRAIHDLHSAAAEGGRIGQTARCQCCPSYRYGQGEARARCAFDRHEDVGRFRGRHRTACQDPYSTYVTTCSQHSTRAAALRCAVALQCAATSSSSPSIAPDTAAQFRNGVPAPDAASSLPLVALIGVGLVALGMVIVSIDEVQPREAILAARDAARNPDRWGTRP